MLQAGLLAPGSSIVRAFPIRWISGSVRKMSPVTAAGPLPICTGFPISSPGEHLKLL